MKHSKLVWQNIYYMLCYCVDELAYFNDAYIDYDELNGTHDLLAALLCNSFELLYKNGYIKEYSKEQIITSKPRGRVNIPKSIERGSIGSAKLVCNVSNIGIDSELNRIIKASFSILIESNKLVDDKINKNLMTKLYKYREMLDNVSDIEISLRELYSITEMPEWYRPIFTVCKLIWNDWIAFDKEGNHRLLELNDRNRLWVIWQKYLFNLAKREFSEYKVCRPSFSGIRHNWKTDLVIEDISKKYALIADAKWYDESDMSTANMSQINTYESKYLHKYSDRTTDGIIVYASNSETTIFPPEPMDNGKTVTEVLININQNKDSMEKDILDIFKSYLNETKLEEP